MEINQFKFIEGRSNTLVLLYPKYFAYSDHEINLKIWHLKSNFDSTKYFGKFIF